MAQSKNNNQRIYEKVRKYKVVLLIICSIFSVTYLSVEFLFNAGGLRPIDSIIATDYFNSDVLSLPLSFDEGYRAGSTATFFKSSKSLAEINKRIIEITNWIDCKTELFDDNNLLIKKTDPTDNNKSALYLLKKSADNNEYYFFNLSAEFTKYNPINKANPDSVKIIFPYYLVDDTRFDNKYAGFEMGEYYSTKYSIDKFFEFYQVLNMFNIEKKDNMIFIKGYARDLSAYANLPQLSTPIIISFKSENNQSYFKIDFST